MSTNTNEYVDLLRKELSLIDDEDYLLKKQQYEIEYRNKIKDIFKKDLSYFDLDDAEYFAISRLSLSLPDWLFKRCDVDSLIFFDDLDKITEEKRKELHSFLQYISENNVEGAPKCSSPSLITINDKNETIEALLESIQHGDITEVRNASYKIIDRFMQQSHDCQIQIMKTMLKIKNCDRRWCRNILLKEWWDDALIPDVERVWKETKDDTNNDIDFSGVIARRFPIDYVVKNQDCIFDYYELSKRLIKTEGFEIDKERLSKLQYTDVFSSNYIHIDESVADDLLFGHILQYLDKDKRFINRDARPRVETIYDDYPSSFDIYDFFADYKLFYSYLTNYKPSLWFFPDVKRIIRDLCNSGNTSTVVKFILWNKRLQSCIPGLLSEEFAQAVYVEDPIDRFKEYQEWSWDIFMKLAKETFPLDRSKITMYWDWDWDIDVEELFC